MAVVLYHRRVLLDPRGFLASRSSSSCSGFPDHERCCSRNGPGRVASTSAASGSDEPAAAAGAVSCCCWSSRRWRSSATRRRRSPGRGRPGRTRLRLQLLADRHPGVLLRPGGAPAVAAAPLVARGRRSSSTWSSRPCSSVRWLGSVTRPRPLGAPVDGAGLGAVDGGPCSVKGEDTSFVYYATFTRLSGLLGGALLAMLWGALAFADGSAPAAGRVLDAVERSARRGALVLPWRVNAVRRLHLSGDSSCSTSQSWRSSPCSCTPPPDWGGLLRPAAPRLGRTAVPTRSTVALSRSSWSPDRTWTPDPRAAAVHPAHRRSPSPPAELSFRFVETPLRHGAIDRGVANCRTARGPPPGAGRRAGIGLGALGLVVLIVSEGCSAPPRDPARERIDWRHWRGDDGAARRHRRGRRR